MHAPVDMGKRAWGGKHRAVCMWLSRASAEWYHLLMVSAGNPIDEEGSYFLLLTPFCYENPPELLLHEVW